MLVTDIETLKKYVPVIVGKDFSKYEPFVVEAREWLKKEITGSALFDALEAEGNETLKGYCERIVSNKAYLVGLPFFDLVETEAGFAVMRTDTKAPASRERVEALRAGVESWLSDSIERCLEYLEETMAYHEDWKGSPVYSLLSDTYIHTLRMFRRFAPFEGNQLAFVAAKPKMLSVIRLKIEPVISPELSDQIIEQLRDNEIIDTKNEAILPNLRFAFANYVAGNDDDGRSYLMKVKKVINRTPDDYPAYRDSDLYATILAQTADKNSIDKPIFRAGF
jgi:hypothetical protein